jgi:hypothetical protein
MRKVYGSPSLAVFGSLRELTAGFGGTSPDVATGINNLCSDGGATLISGSSFASCPPGTGGPGLS